MEDLNTENLQEYKWYTKKNKSQRKIWYLKDKTKFNLF